MLKKRRTCLGEWDKVAQKIVFQSKFDFCKASLTTIQIIWERIKPESFNGRGQKLILARFGNFTPLEMPIKIIKKICLRIYEGNKKYQCYLDIGIKRGPRESKPYQKGYIQSSFDFLTPQLHNHTCQTSQYQIC